MNTATPDFPSPLSRNGQPVGAVMVVGGGIAGMQASLDLADAGFKVYLVEKGPAIGGHMAALDKTFPTNDCATCIVAPKLVEVGRHPNIELLTLTQLEAVEGEAGHFRAALRQAPRYVVEDLCTGCAICWGKCPVRDIPSEFHQRLGARPAIYVDTPQAIPLVPVIDAANCRYVVFREAARGLPEGQKPRAADGRRMIECRICEKLCPQHAVDFNQTERTLELKVGAVILAAGFDLFDARAVAEYGYGAYPNVITSLEFERILSASGPTLGRIRRPSDGAAPRRIAFIQCVGSRNPALGNDYCSAVCCMAATKEAIVAGERLPELETAIFYIDLRAFGKGFYRYYQRAKNECGVRYVRSMISAVTQTLPSKNLLLRFAEEDGQIREEQFDLVVLSVGLKPPPAAAEFCERLGLARNRHGFCATRPFSTVETSRPGVFACGTFTGPKDIPQTVMEASAAAACAAQLLAPARGTLVREKETPPERDVAGEESRIGAFVCHCGTNIAGVVDVKAVAEFARSLPGVVVAEDNLHLCAPDAQARIKELIREHKLNRVLVAACSPRTHEPLFQETIQEVGLNKYLFEMANIRDQCSWVHSSNPERATQKARSLVSMGLSRARHLTPLHATKIGVNPRALVIGGGLAGMTAARALSAQGFEAHLVEKEGELGGNLHRLHYTLEENGVQGYLAGLIERVKRDPLIHVYTRARVERVEGCVGNFTTTVRSAKFEVQSEEFEVRSGVIIVATGAAELKGDDYLRGWDERVMTQRELEERIANSRSQISNLKSVVMIQCVGSRDAERPYCSRICCSQALKNALKVKEINPDTKVIVLYRDLMSYGLKEEHYTRARAAGVTFIRYDLDHPPQVRSLKAVLRRGETPSPEDGPSPLAVTVRDANLGMELTLAADLLALSVAMAAPAENQELAQLLKVPLDGDGFFLEAHMKLRPVDFATDGIFVCGLAHSPKFMEETIAQSQAAAARAAAILSRAQIESEAMVPAISLEKCIGCAVCQTVCAFQAIRVADTEIGKRAEVMLAACKGCGLCGAACPYGANTPGHFTDRQLMAQISALAESPRFSGNGFEPRILGFLCNWCAYAGADLAGASRIQYPPNLHVARVMCTGRIDLAFIVEALLQGIDGVIALGCHKGDCHYATGNLHAEERMGHLRQVFEGVGLNPKRFHLDWVSASEGGRFSELVNSFTEQIRELGPIA